MNKLIPIGIGIAAVMIGFSVFYFQMPKPVTNQITSAPEAETAEPPQELPIVNDSCPQGYTKAMRYTTAADGYTLNGEAFCQIDGSYYQQSSQKPNALPYTDPCPDGYKVYEFPAAPGEPRPKQCVREGASTAPVTNSR